MTFITCKYHNRQLADFPAQGVLFVYEGVTSDGVENHNPYTLIPPDVPCGCKEIVYVPAGRVVFHKLRVEVDILPTPPTLDVIEAARLPLI